MEGYKERKEGGRGRQKTREVENERVSEWEKEKEGEKERERRDEINFPLIPSYIHTVQDIPENGADMAHLTYLHSAGVSSGSGVNFKEPLSAKLHTHQWEAKWEALPAPTTHIGRVTVKLTNIILGLKVKALYLNVTADQVSQL